MITFPNTYAVDPKNVIQGPTKVYGAPYVAAGADPSQGSIFSLGLIDKTGIEWDHKPTYTEVEADQFLTPVDAFQTKAEYDMKFNMLELSPANLRFIIGAAAAALVIGGGISTLSLGDPFDVLSSVSNPSTRPPFFALMVQVPSPGHDGTTSPIGAWGYVQFFKAYVQTHGGIKVSKDVASMSSVSVRALTDVTVSGANRIGKIVTQ